MVRDIINFKYFPVWRYGSSSIGSFFAYCAGFFGLIFKTDIFVLSLAELIFSFLFILSTYYVCKAIFDEKGQIVVLLLVSFAPTLLIKSATFPTGVYNIVLFLGNIMFLLALRIWEGRDKKLHPYAILGFISGISFWAHFYTICFLVPCIIFILLKKRFKIKAWLVFIIMFFAGSLPFWFFNFKTGFLTFKNIALKPVEDILCFEAKDILSLQLSNMMDINSFFSISGILCLIYLVSLVYFCYRLSENLFKLKESLILFFIVFGIAVITKIRVNPALDIHPSIILYAGFPYALAYFLINLKGRSKIIYRTAFLFVILLQLGDVLTRSSRINISKNIALNQLMTQLKYSNIRYVYTTRDYAPIINFMANGSVAADYYDEYDDMPYRFITEIKKQPAFVLPKKMGGQLIKNLRYVCKGYKEIVIDPYMIFYSLKRPVKGEIELPSSNWYANSNYNNQNAKFAFDRNACTRWTTNVRQAPDMYFLLDLKEETTINKIAVYLSNDILDRARGLKIEVSNNNKNWKEAVYLKDNINILLCSGPYILWRNHADRQEYNFKPVKARYIKLTQLGFADDNYWSINEIFIYSPSSEKNLSAYNINELSLYMQKEGLKNIYSDYWMSGDAGINRNILPSFNSVIITDGTFDVGDKLKIYNIDYKKDIIGGFFVYHSLKPRYPLIPISKNGWTGSSNVQQSGAHLAFDGDLRTRWSTEKFQSKGSYFQIDFKEEKDIAGVRLWHEGSPNDWSRGIRFEYLDNKSSWQKLEYRKDFSEALYWTGFSVIVDSSKNYTYIFKPVKTKAIRCILEENNNEYYWSIHELDLFAPANK